MDEFVFVRTLSSFDQYSIWIFIYILLFTIVGFIVIFYFILLTFLTRFFNVILYFADITSLAFIFNSLSFLFYKSILVFQISHVFSLTCNAL